MTYTVKTHDWFTTKEKSFTANKFQDAVDYFRAMADKANTTAVELFLNIENLDPIRLDYNAD